MFPVVITGSRQWKRENKEQIEDWILDNLLDPAFYAEPKQEVQIAHGKSHGGGVDLYVAEICDHHRIPQWPFPVRPDLDGRHRGAPLNRNKRMVKTFMPQLVVGFYVPGREGGTGFTVDYAESLGIEVRKVFEQ